MQHYKGATHVAVTRAFGFLLFLTASFQMAPCLFNFRISVTVDIQYYNSFGYVAQLLDNYIVYDVIPPISPVLTGHHT